ncbi:nuclear transport factor 2 family protein [Pseudomonas sp. 008]|jgi:hypothetical protein|uniref:nuclear transport factor 2 family protein n=1 Tax=Pseudomonas sp. 008 TaxID=2803906 RepID=UPI001952885A|nr:nuclear transport factor 2 family protein [Pseudomonas sp. 008]GID03005.1 hypothetical protein TMM008_02070 [Pseudomonas sp. 008]
MDLTLHPLIEAYLRSESDDDTGALDQVFSATAVVKDEGRSIEGIAAIKKWKQESKHKYQYTVEPLGSRVVMTARLTGNFPGSPIVVNYTFGMQDGKIQTLEIA